MPKWAQTCPDLPKIDLFQHYWKTVQYFFAKSYRIINTQYDCLLPYCGIHYKFYIGHKTALSQSECLIFMLYVPKRGGPTKSACSSLFV